MSWKILKYSTVVVSMLPHTARRIKRLSARRLGSKFTEEANKEATSDLFHLGVRFNCSSSPPMTGQPEKREICTHIISNVLSSISESAIDSYQDNSCEEHGTFVERCIVVLSSWKTVNLRRW